MCRFVRWRLPCSAILQPFARPHGARFGETRRHHADRVAGGCGAGGAGAVCGSDGRGHAAAVSAVAASRCRAFTIVHRRGYAVRAQVHLPPSRSLTELVGHEFEHLIEQIEGLDLKRLARVKGSGVHEGEGRVFETDRAQMAGRVVADEVDRYSRAPFAD